MTLATVAPTMFAAAFGDVTYRCTACKLGVRREDAGSDQTSLPVQCQPQADQRDAQQEPGSASAAKSAPLA